jgi:glutathione S-transferase
MLTLYHAPLSVCSQKVRIGLALMQTDYDSRVLDLQKGDQFEPEYMALNPDAVVPTLIDGGLVVVESSLILAYLDRSYNADRLLPSDPGSRVQAEHWLLRCLAIHAAINTMSFATAMRQTILATKTQAEIEAQAARMPDPIMGAKRLDLIFAGLASPYVGQAMVHLKRLFADMQAALSVGPWMGGDAAGIVDVALVAYVDRLDRLGLASLWEGEFASVTPWLSRWRDTRAYADGIEKWIPDGSAEAMHDAGRANLKELEEVWRTAS